MPAKSICTGPVVVRGRQCDHHGSKGGGKLNLLDAPGGSLLAFGNNNTNQNWIRADGSLILKDLYIMSTEQEVNSAASFVHLYSSNGSKIGLVAENSEFRTQMNAEKTVLYRIKKLTPKNAKNEKENINISFLSMDAYIHKLAEEYEGATRVVNDVLIEGSTLAELDQGTNKFINGGRKIDTVYRNSETVHYKVVQPAGQVITKVQTQIKKPVHGNIPDKTAWVPANARYDVTNVTWMDTETGKEMNPSDKFIGGKTYRVKIDFKAKYGVFDYSVTTVYINGNIDDVVTLGFTGETMSKGYDFTVPVPVVDAPIISPGSGEKYEFVESVQISISHPSPNADIYYTTNGTNPNPRTSECYNGPFTIKNRTVIRAISVVDKYN